MHERKPASYRLSEECRQQIRQIAERLGIRDAGAVELAVRFFLSWVQPARGVDASFLNESLAPVSRASSATSFTKNWNHSVRFGVRPLDFRDHIAVRARISCMSRMSPLASRRGDRRRPHRLHPRHRPLPDARRRPPNWSPTSGSCRLRRPAALTAAWDCTGSPDFPAHYLSYLKLPVAPRDARGTT